MPPLSRVNLTLAQKNNTIEKYGLPGHDHKKIAEKYDVSEKDYTFDIFDHYMNLCLKKEKNLVF